MAVAAGDRAVGAQKRKLGFGMIEAVDVCPGLDAMAGFATERCAIGALASHAIVELALVWILVTSGAITIFEMIRHDFVGATCGAKFVTVGAGNRHVTTGEGEAGVAMFGDGEGGAMEILHSVARLAAVVIRSGSKLIVVGVLVAVAAVFELHFVDGVFSRGEVALITLDGNVFALERIF